MSRCRNGHVRTNENTKRVVVGDGVYNCCLTCLVNRETKRGRHDPKRPHPRDRSSCKNGHEYVDGSFKTYIEKNSRVRRCRICQKQKSKEYRERKKYEYLLTPR
jgi:hypothetical protein